MSPADRTLHKTIVRANARAWGIATGLLFGFGLFLATLVLVLKGGDDVGQHLGHLSQIFPGYDVTLRGSVIGFVYAFVLGYALGRIIGPRHPLEREGRRSTANEHVRINGGSWGLATGLILALGLFAATNALVLRGGEHVGDLLRHLALYLPGYAVTFQGSLIGAAYLFAIGYVSGRIVGWVYNSTVERAERASGVAAARG